MQCETLEVMAVLTPFLLSSLSCLNRRLRFSVAQRLECEVPIRKGTVTAYDGRGSASAGGAVAEATSVPFN
jgi:hypothetical protein